MDKEQKATIIQEYGKSEGDVGSTEVQVALLTARISELTEHLRTHRKDHSSRRGLIALVNRRRKLLDYLRKSDMGTYSSLISRLKIRR